MKKNIFFGVLASAAVMLALPWLAAVFVKDDAGMAVCFLLFYAVNPLFSVTVGAYAGKDIRRLWGLPLMAAVMFPVGAWLFLDMGEAAFILYGAVYLVLGTAAMTVSMCITKKTQR